MKHLIILTLLFSTSVITVSAQSEAVVKKNNAGLTKIEFPNNGNNLLIGESTGSSITGGLRNVLLGNYTGLGLTNGDDNTLIGVGAGNLASGSGNVALGYNAGQSNTGTGNVFLGKEAGFLSGATSNRLYIANSPVDSSQALIYGEFNNNYLRLNAKVFIRDGWSDSDGDTKIQLDNGMDDDTLRVDIGGLDAYKMYQNASGNIIWDVKDNNENHVFIGNNAGVANTNNIFDGQVFIGNQAGAANVNGDSNVFIGGEAGSKNISGYENVYLGADAGLNITDAHRNVFIGHNAGRDKTTGGSNVMIGEGAGYSNTSGSDNVFLGKNAGFSAQGSNQLIIENTASDSTEALIYGEFDNDLLRFNGKVGIGGTPDQDLHIATGDAPTILIQSDGTDEESGRISLRQSNNTGADILYDGTNDNDAFAIETFSGGTSNGNKLTIDLSGNVSIDKSLGIGTLDPKAELQVEGSGWFKTDGGSLGSGAGKGVRVFHDNQLQTGNVFAYDYDANESIDLVLQQPGGTVSIGPNGPATGYKLSVNGKIICTELRVDLRGDWPDYVFLEGYKLPTLTEVKKHIKDKGHLIGVPSAKDIKEDGLQLGEMNKVLMEKIEELTLYILQQEERIQKLEQSAQK